MRLERGAVHVRISARSTGQTMFIVLSNDDPATYRLANRCQRWAMEVKQDHVRETLNVVIPPNEHVDFAWDHAVTGAKVMMRALAPVEGPQSPSRRGSARSMWSPQAREIVAEAGDVTGVHWVPVSKWFAYEVETVSEKESLHLPNDGAAVRVEGMVDGKTRVLNMSDMGSSASALLSSSVVLQVEVTGAQDMPSYFTASYRALVSVGGKSKLTTVPGPPGQPLHFELDEMPYSLLINLLIDAKASATARIKLACLRLMELGEWVDVHGEQWVRAEAQLQSRFLAVAQRTNAGLLSAPRKGGLLVRMPPPVRNVSMGVSHNEDDDDGNDDDDDENAAHAARAVADFERDGNASAHPAAADDGMDDAETAKTRKTKKKRADGMVALEPTAAKHATVMGEDDHAARGDVKKWPRLAIRVRVLRKPDDVVEETKFKLDVTSLGTSLMNASRGKEVCYLCVQRLFFSLRMRENDFEIRANVGNVQLDSFADGARFPIALRPELPDETLLNVNLVWYRSTIDVLFMERVRIVMRRLEVCIEEPLIAAVANVAASGAMQSALQFMDGAQVSTHPMVEGAHVATTDAGAVRMFYVDALEISNLRVNIRLDLNGGRQLEANTDQLSSALAVYLPVLEVDALLLRFAGMFRTGIFESEAKLKRRIYEHYAVEALQNSHKLLTNVSYLGNPAQAGRKFASGFFHFISEPLTGLKDRGTLSGFMRGVQNGFTVLVADMTSGLTESVHGLSLAITSAYGFMEQSGANDVTIRPIASAVAVIRDVSGAVAQGANEISVEVMDHDDRFKATWVRETRPFSPQGAVLVYGGGAHPLEIEQRIERASARRIQMWWRRLRARANASNAEFIDVVAAKEEAVRAARRAAREAQERGHRRRLRRLRAWLGSFGVFVGDCFAHVQEVYKSEVKEAVV